MSDHTPTPWTYRAASNVGDGIIIGGKNSNAAFVPGYNDHPHNIANAAYIVKAVNSHDALLKALEKIAAMDPQGIRADDLGRAARIAADGIRSAGGNTGERHMRDIHERLLDKSEYQKAAPGICILLDAASEIEDLRKANQILHALLSNREDEIKRLQASLGQVEADRESYKEQMIRAQLALYDAKRVTLSPAERGSDEPSTNAR